MSWASERPMRPSEITGHLQVRGEAGRRRTSRDGPTTKGGRRTTTLGGAHVKDSGRRTPRGAVIWRAAPGPCPRGSLTPKMAEAALEELLDEARLAIPDDAGRGRARPRMSDVRRCRRRVAGVPRGREAPQAQHAAGRAQRRARRNLLPRFGRDTPLYLDRAPRGRRSPERSAVRRGPRGAPRPLHDRGRRRVPPRAARLGPVAADGAEGPRAVARRVQAREASQADREQPVRGRGAGLARGRRDLQRARADRVRGRVSRRARPAGRATGSRSRSRRDRQAQPGERELYGALLSTAFYAGPRLGELRDLPWRNVDFDGSMSRIESGLLEGTRSTPKGKRARSTPLVPILAQRLAALATRERFTARRRLRVLDRRSASAWARSDPRGLLRGPRPRRPRPSTRRRRPARQPAASDPSSRSSPLVVHLGGQRVAADEGAGLRRSPGRQDHAAVRPPPDQDRGCGSRRRVPGRGAVSEPSCRTADSRDRSGYTSATPRGLILVTQSG